MTNSPILPGAEPFAADGGRVGVLVLHGFTGTPQSMRGLAEAFAGAGFAVELPLLPGHGTTLDDMELTGWDDWYAAADRAYTGLAARCDRVLVAGLSMGGTLALSLALDHPEVAGVIVVNPLVEVSDPALVDSLKELLADGVTRIPAIASDIADPGARELAYDGTPVGPLVTLMAHVALLPDRLGALRCPVLVLTSRQDHVVDPASSDVLASEVAGPVERVALERSFHVATLDHDRQEIEERAVAFARGITD